MTSAHGDADVVSRNSGRSGREMMAAIGPVTVQSRRHAPVGLDSAKMARRSYLRDGVECFGGGITSIFALVMVMMSAC